MSDYRNFEKYLKGEWYPGCPRPVSEWRRNFDSYMENKSIVPVLVPAKVEKKKRPYVKQGLSETKREYMRKRRIWAKKNGVCADCFKEPSRKNKTCCQRCQDTRTARELGRYQAKVAA